MVTFAQAQERAERWVNGDVPGYQHREVRVREFDLGFVAWSEDRESGPVSDGGGSRLVIARDSGETTLWPALPVGEVIRRYEEEYGAVQEAAPAPASPQRLDLEATSFLLTPPEWLQQAADQMGIPDQRRTPTPSPSSLPSPSSASSAPVAPPPPAPVPGADASSGGAAPGVSPWAGADTGGASSGEAQRPPATVFAPPLIGSDEDGTPPPPSARSEARTELLPESGGALPRTAIAPALNEPGAQAAEGAPAAPGAPGANGPDDAQPQHYRQGGPNDPNGSQQGPNGPNGPGAPGGPGGQGSGAGAGPGTGGGDVHHAATMLADPSEGGLQLPQPPGASASPGAGDIADAATSRAARGSGPTGQGRHSRGSGPSVPPPPGAPGTPGARSGPGTPAPGAPAQGGASAPPSPAAPGAPGAAGAPGGGYVPTQMVSADDLAEQINQSGQHLKIDGPGEAGGAGGAPGAPGTPGASGTPGAPGTSGAPGASPAPSASGGTGSSGGPGTPGTPGGPGGDVHQAATMLAGPGSASLGGAGPTTPPPPSAPPPAPGTPPPGAPGPGMPGAPGPGAPQAGASYGFPQPQPPVQPQPQPGAPAYGYPQAQGQPTVGPGYMAVLRYRAADGSEQQLIRRSAPGTPHPEWQLLHELRGMNIPPQQVVELHTELESCDLPGGYCTRMIRETWPQVRISHTAAYGTDHASRQQGMRHLIEHQGELHQVADGPARPAPNRVPLPPPHQIQPTPPVPPDAIGQELMQAFGPQGVFRFDQRAVSRQGVPDIVAQTLVWAGVPIDVTPFFWGQAQPNRPVPTLAELAQERGVQPASDAGSYLVMGTDFGRQLCVQYGTAHIVAVPLEGGPGGQPGAPQFVNTGLPEFVRCMAMLGRMWRLRYGLTQEQAGRWTVDFQSQLAALDAAALSSPENWWSVLLEQMWDGLF
ncbi:SUKH-4 family immunity protein [Streptomyces axinellae]|uniref:Nucleic acid/nucleotide deaminase of polymorphic system toxin n=1 Tax=Streptomyces axinellae TaxID=552788 RepID=A0ABN3Q966_9ACTN